MIPSIAVILTDATKKILWVNDDFTKITGYSLPEVFGQNPGRILQGPESEKDAIQQIRQGLKSNMPFRGEITNYRKSGEEYLCRLVIHPVFDNDQRLTNYIAFEVDGNTVKEEELQLPLLELEEKYSSSSLKVAEEIKLYFELKELVETEKLYLDSSLTLKDIADQLNTNTKYLSQVINHHIGSNFQTFVNAYRIEEAKEKILDDKYSNLTLFGIALQCGFKNKSTFYKVFRDKVGMTPKAYLKNIASQQEK
ncbi:MAG: helix-turn-helix domain-containing protein [Bacteroidetes bacterium]|jgi:PAS domain S-box-containing protein|nr:helix-turn-helix domain-containing protein [Bacteroidota bacterium]